MKIEEQAALLMPVRVEYFGTPVEVPDGTTHLATDQDGRLFAYSGEPDLVIAKGWWEVGSMLNWCCPVARVELPERIHWTMSLQKINGSPRG